MIKVLASDYDKTFYLNDEDVKNNIQAIKEFRKENNIFIFATGRSYLDFKEKVNKYNLEYDYAILNHGATIIDNEDNILYNIYIDNKIIKDLITDLKLNYSIKNFFCKALDSRVTSNLEDLTKINARYASKEEAIDIFNSINNKYRNYIKAYMISKTSIEIISNKVNKAIAIKYIADKLNISYNNIYTVGDSYSDINMIKEFNGYCMKNSIDELKKLSIKECESVYKIINYIKGL